MRKIVFDVDDLIHMLSERAGSLREVLSNYRSEGFEIVLNIPAKIPGENTEALSESFDKIKMITGYCDAVLFGGPDKPMRGLHVDDKVVSLDEFLSLPFEDLSALVEKS